MANKEDYEWSEAASDLSGSDSGEDDTGGGTDKPVDEIIALLHATEPAPATVLRLEAVVCCKESCFIGKRVLTTHLINSLRPKSKSVTHAPSTGGAWDPMLTLWKQKYLVIT